MVEQESLSSQQVDAYLKRLGLDDVRPGQASLDDARLEQVDLVDTGLCDLATLNILVCAHQCSIPFESMDMHRAATPPDLALETLFDKIVTRRRGGYCFELNRLFMMLLTRLGFTAHAVFGRIKRPDGERPPITHRGTIVELGDSLYYVDVGFGGPIAAGALVFEEGKKQRFGNECYRMKRIDSTWWAVDRIVSVPRAAETNRSQQKTVSCTGQDPQSTDSAASVNSGGGVSGRHRPSLSTEGVASGNSGEALYVSPEEQIGTVMEICTARVEEQDFDALNLWCSQPGARFRETMVANIRTQAGYCSIDNNTLVVCEDGRKEQFPLSTEEDLSQATKEYFGFEL